MLLVIRGRLLDRVFDAPSTAFVPEEDPCLISHLSCVPSPDSTEESNLHKELLTSLLILVLVVIIFVVLVGYFFRWVFVGPCSGSAPSLVPSHGSKRGGRASAWHRRRRARPARAASMNRKSFSRITWWVKKGPEELLLPLSRGAQANVVSLFQVQETQESCGELRRQKDAKWDLGRTRYGEVCFQTLRFVCVCLVL